MPRNRIGVSLASYLPWSAFFTRKATRWAEKDGFGFIGMLPLRGSVGITPSLPISYLEGAWNPVRSLREALSGQPTGQGLVPNIADWLFFPNPERSQEIFEAMKIRQPPPVIVVHSIEEWQKGRLLEVSPRINMETSEIASWAKKHRAQLVLDTYHLRRSVWEHLDERGMPLEKWQLLIPRLLPFVKVVHVQPNQGDELSEIMRGEDTELHKMLRFIRQNGFSGHFMVEATLGAKGITLWKLRQMLRAMRQLVEDNAL